MAINYCYIFQEKKQCIQQQEEGMPLGHEFISHQQSSSTYGTLQSQLQYSRTGCRAIILVLRQIGLSSLRVSPETKKNIKA
jgi:hypothetical protein